MFYIYNIFIAQSQRKIGVNSIFLLFQRTTGHVGQFRTLFSSRSHLFTIITATSNFPFQERGFCFGFVVEWKKKARLMKKKTILITILSIIIVIVVGGFILYFSLPEPLSRGHNDARVYSAISQARTVMVYLESSEGNYDSFNCEHKDIASICEEIEFRGGEAIIARDKASSSESACIYSLLPYRSSKKQGFWRKTKDYWLCTDSNGQKGYTTIDPGSNGYCLEGESAVCPPFVEE